MAELNTGAKSTSGWSRYFERELGWLLILVLGLYATRLTDLSIRGEESRRGRIAWEMIHGGDWLVPRVQGIPRLSRPPMQYWLIALTGELRGRVDAVAVRLPSVLATLLTVLLIYSYGRCWMSRTGSFAAGAIYATFVQVLQLGRLGETEAIFTFLLSAALLVWHMGVLLRWNQWVLWTVAYSLAAAATLTKGPQAPVYFVGGIGLFLLLTRNWRWSISWSHATGIGVLLAIVGAWQIPFSMALGQQKVSYVYLSEVAKRFENNQWATIISHITLFPIEIVAGCLFPWSLLLLAYAYKGFRDRIQTARLPLIYLAGCIAIAFPSVWIPPEARSRYFMPLFPCFALLCGYVIEQGWQTAGAGLPSWLSFWKARPQQCVAGLACLIGALYVGPIMSYQVSHSRDAASDVERAKKLLPASHQLASFGVVHHLFSYHFDDQIAHYRWPQSADQVDTELDYFCFDAFNSRHKPVPFAWIEVARVNCDRNQRPRPECEVIIGRRLRADVPVTSKHVRIRVFNEDCSARIKSSTP
ncbi:MAG: 4-amino-4-deoxy-L-arabinose transferase, partial [Planctomycetaceae bacterium]|nr:4-amino-4-deoxy-L-arabinose transferase [Planctomycetaceae bacterium]